MLGRGIAAQPTRGVASWAAPIAAGRGSIGASSRVRKAPVIPPNPAPRPAPPSPPGGLSGSETKSGLFPGVVRESNLAGGPAARAVVEARRVVFPLARSARRRRRNVNLATPEAPRGRHE